MAFTNAQKFVNVGMPFPLAKQVGDAIDGATSTKPAIVAISAFTDSTAGTPSTTVVGAIPAATAASTDTTAASLASTNASLAALRNDLSSLTVKMNTILAALKAA